CRHSCPGILDEAAPSARGIEPIQSGCCSAARQGPQSAFGARPELQSRDYPPLAAKTPPGATAMATSIIHDLPDGRDATAALRAAAKTAINRPGRPWRGLIQGRANINIAQYITGTDNHGARYTDGVGFGTPHR